ncbi:MAG TPA: hypothetical protein VJ842_18490 [Pyrinomonadaceae bacterium]|nr:hypothetical protein [Pyrinomonadaceae bacterium]
MWHPDISCDFKLTGEPRREQGDVQTEAPGDATPPPCLKRGGGRGRAGRFVCQPTNWLRAAGAKKN